MFNVFASLVHVRLQTLAKVLNSLCHLLLRKFVPDFLRWFRVPQSLVAVSLACGRFLTWHPTRDSQQQWPLCHVSPLATSAFKVRFPVKLKAHD